MRRWWRAWMERREARSLEVFLFNYGPHDKWRQVRDANRAAGVWRRWPL